MRLLIPITLVLFAIFYIVGCDDTNIESGLTFEQYLSIADQSINAGRIEKAISAYKKALEIKPKDADTHFKLAELYNDEYRKSFDEARRQVQGKALLHPSEKQNKDIEKEYIKHGLKIEYLRNALYEYREVLKYDANNWIARMVIADNYRNKKQYQKAIGEYNKVININPYYINSYIYLGEVFSETGNYNAAIEKFEQAISIDPNFPYVYYQLGLVYRKVNNGKKFNDMINKLKEMNSTFAEDLRLSIYR